MDAKSENAKKWSFTRRLKESHFSKRLNVPESFVSGTEIARSGTIVLRNDKGKEWPVSITKRDAQKYSITAGWNDFLQANNLVPGDVIRFAFVPGSDNLVQTKQIFRNQKQEVLNHAKPPSFFKVLITNNFDLQLRLPQIFVQKYKAILSENMKLTSCFQETSWEVKVEQMDDQDYYFTNGWKKFTEDMKIEKLDFLVFEYSGNSVFDVTIFESSGCIREPATATIKEDKDEEDGRTWDSSNNPRFEIVLKPYMCSRMTIPKRFAEAADLVWKDTVRLECHPGGNFGYVAVNWRSSGQCLLVSLAVGWSDFRNANRLVYGKKYSFEYIPTTQAIHVTLAQ